ncbi:helix-turn-helix domain-containing protein [Actinophytocola algeriensis]|uniref:Uncharacterized protein n=1 Tax=Actinophytocola algeriensis TaxID=1768010 RepID=A0A7W7QAP0_9PSEU|nr:hypothetical protein [Actinophytocola algeriensis]MBB4910176.1 hypothetical protein [Actinophytocola algeriensis]MBE1480835.1 hypothetical protein [Actinophytocola algeriensis]
MTVAIRVLDELRRCSVPLDDDQLAKRLSVSPRQTINQVCRRLAAEGRLRRFDGPDGKIVNELQLTDGEVLVRELPAGDSTEQRQAEAMVLQLLGERLGLTLRPCNIPLGDGVRAEVDGVDEAFTTLVEVWARHGPPKPAQKHKVLADALKLIHVGRVLRTSPRLILCLCDAEAARHFSTARSWAADALRAFDVEVIVIDVPADVSAAVRAAQLRQVR